MEDNKEMDISVDCETGSKDDEDLISAILGSVNDPDFENWDLWDLVPKISQYLSKYHSAESKNLNSLSKQAINKIASVANPKEFILIMLSEFEENFDDVKFCALLEPLRCALARLPDEHGKSLQWCLNSIYDCLSKQLDLPDDYNLEGEEKLLLDNDDDYLAVCKVYVALFDFYQSLLSDILNALKLNNEDIKKSKKFKDIIVIHLIKILGRPIVHLDLEVSSSETPKSRIRKIVESLIALIFSVSCDVLSYFEKIDHSANLMAENSDLIPVLSAANFYYLIFCEKIADMDKVPKVYNLCYLRYNLFPQATALISHDESLIRRKGLLLSDFMFSELDCNFALESALIESLMQGLITCITYEKTEENRKLSFSVFKNYISQLSIKEKYLTFLNLRGIITNSSLTAHVITCIKDTLIKNYKHPLFSHKYLFDLIHLYCKLPDGATTDLMESASEIIAALNFIRFLIIRDKSNELGFFRYLDKVHEILLNPLVEDLKMSRSHWELKSKEIKDEIGEDDKVSLTVGRQKLPEMPKEERIKVVNSAFNCMDLLESLLARVNECISEVSASHS